MIIAGFDKFTTLDYPGMLSALIYTFGCTMRCPFCHNPELVTGNLKSLNRFSEEEVIEFMSTRIGLLDGLSITGGEPTLHKDLTDFINKIKDLGFKVKLDTYGLNSKRVREIIDMNLFDYWVMDVKGNDQTYNSCGYKSKKSAIKNVQESIQIIMNSGSDYEFRTTVLKSKLWHTDKLMDEIGEKIIGARNYYIQNFRAVKTLYKSFQGNNKYSFTDSELQEMKTRMSKYVTNVQIKN